MDYEYCPPITDEPDLIDIEEIQEIEEAKATDPLTQEDYEHGFFK